MDVIFLISLFYLIHRVLSNGCKDMDFKITIEGQALVNHTFLTTQATNDGHCESKCFMDDLCISYNFGRSTSGQSNTCELNEADHKQFPNDLVPRPGTMYRNAENTCDCSTNEVCRMDFIQKTHFCFAAKNCKSFKVVRADYFLDGSGQGQTGLCRGVFKSPSGNTPAEPYRITVEMYTYLVTASSSGAMHPGIGFNVKDEDNFNFVYFRTHVTASCSGYVTQPGRLQANSVKIMNGACSYYVPPANAWFKVEIKVYPGQVKVFIDDNYATTYSGMSTTLIKRGALMVFNGYGNAVKFRNYRIENL
ncbi:uncharacterized skeletal organic matrix protein 7-like [Actinia tenebrosa]|uniref:Uncharacterized skeletal organic matrix protein 7-like n=1 Tax=Actinia tenebrosa TaxID=6105 RepID=A0A6P8HS72_ACTTE|nr:uncharacterized skeletal organic matrix protein 7-like [Actinia tenebrosa]